MITTCSVPRCGKRTKRHTHLCSKHQKNQRRHGHAQQVPLSAYELRRYTRHIRRLIDGRPNREAIWSSLLEAYELLVREAASEVNRVKVAKGVARRSSFEVDYAIVTVSGEAQAEDVVITLVALGYLAAFNPRRFISDEAFFTTMALRFRRLAPSNFTRIINPATGRKAMVSNDFNPKAQLLLGQRLANVFAAFGMKMCEIEEREGRKAVETKKAPLLTLDAA